MIKFKILKVDAYDISNDTNRYSFLTCYLHHTMKTNVNESIKIKCNLVKLNAEKRDKSVQSIGLVNFC